MKLEAQSEVIVMEREVRVCFEIFISQLTSNPSLASLEALDNSEVMVDCNSCWRESKGGKIKNENGQFEDSLQILQIRN